LKVPKDRQPRNRRSKDLRVVGVAVVGALVCVILGSVLVVGASAFHFNGQYSASVGGARTCGLDVPGGLKMFAGPHNPFSGEGSSQVAFVMAPHSIAHVCIAYSLAQGIKPIAGGQSPLYASIYVVTATSVRNANYSGYAYSYSPAPEVSISGSQSSISDSVLESAGVITVAYTITASGNTTGFYGLSFTNSCPSVIPFAITNDAVSVSSSNFPGLTAPSGCRVVQPLAIGLITGYDRLQVKSVGETP